MRTDYILSSFRLAMPSLRTDPRLVSEPSPSSAIYEGGELGCGLPILYPFPFYHTQDFCSWPLYAFAHNLVEMALGVSRNLIVLQHVIVPLAAVISIYNAYGIRTGFSQRYPYTLGWRLFPPIS